MNEPTKIEGHEISGATVHACNASLTIVDTAIRQDDEGRYCLNDLHRSAGGEKRHQPANWMRLDATQALMGEIDHSSEVRSASTINGGTAPGT